MGGAQGFGPGHGMPSFSPVTGGSPMMGGGMGAQQQMAQIYMLYGMLGGRGNVSTGVANPFVNGGFGSLPYLLILKRPTTTRPRCVDRRLPARPRCEPNGPSKIARPSWPRANPPRSRPARKTCRSTSSIPSYSCYPGRGSVFRAHATSPPALRQGSMKLAILGADRDTLAIARTIASEGTDQLVGCSEIGSGPDAAELLALRPARH